MKTARFLGLVFLGLGALTAIAAIWRPPAGDPTKAPFVWASDNSPARSEQIGEFNRLHPDLHLSLDYGNSGGVEKTIMQCTSHVGPDVFDIYGGEQMQAYAESGILLDLTALAKEKGFSAGGSDAWPGGQEQVVYQGRQYAYPCNTGVNILIYNRNVFDALNLPYPQGLMTWDEFIRLGQKITEASQGRVLPVAGLSWQVLFESRHGEFFTKEGAPNLAANADLRLALQMHKDMIFRYRIMPTAVELNALSGQGGWGSGSLNQFSAGRFAMIITGQWALIAFGRTYQQQMEDLKKRGLPAAAITDPLQRPLRLGCILIPKYPDLPPAYAIFSRSAGINAFSSNRESAVKFVQFLAGPEYSRLINQAADALPGNPRFTDIGLEPGPDALARLDMHKATVEAIRHGYSYQYSPFLLNAEVARVLKTQVSRLESDPRLEVDKLLETAQAELDKLAARNRIRNPALPAFSASP